MLVQAGDAVDETIALLSAHMEVGDVLVDGGNEWYPNSIRLDNVVFVSYMYILLFHFNFMFTCLF
jgi:6-phosphogluconate dehydrogenase